MNKLISRFKAPDKQGQTQSITPESANWEYVGFEVRELEAAQSISLETGKFEVCLVVIAGSCSIQTKDLKLDKIGERQSPFERKRPWAVYVPNNDLIEVKAITNLELAICKAPGMGNHKARLISPDQIGVEKRGKGFNKRLVHNILPETEPADSLLVVEVYTDEGNTSSYPSHKHDTDNYPQETYLEETYYHRLDPPQGFSFQRVYTEDGEIDEALVVKNKDVVMVPKGYHPVATIAGYDNYYLNVMAGPVRKWCFTWEEDHNWVNSNAYPRE